METDDGWILGRSGQVHPRHPEVNVPEQRATLHVHVIVYDGTAEQAAQSIKDSPVTFDLPGGGEVEITGASVEQPGRVAVNATALATLIEHAHDLNERAIQEVSCSPSEDDSMRQELETLIDSLHQEKQP